MKQKSKVYQKEETQVDRMRRGLASGLAAALTSIALIAAAPSTAQAQFPERPITLVLPLTAGGPTDVLAREVARRLEVSLGQPVTVENRTGANGQIATEYVASQRPDGYTLLFTTNSIATLGITNPTFNTDVFDILSPITMIEQRPLVVMSSEHAPFETFAQMLEYARANPGALNCGVVGAINELSAAWIHSAAGIDAQRVRYGGSANVYVALLNGEVDYHQTFVEPVLQHIESGAIRVIATLGEQRDPRFPDAPSVSEILPGVHWNAWTGMLAPAGTPDEIVEKLHAAIVAALEDPELVAMLDAQGSQKGGMSSEDFAQEIANVRETFTQIAKEAELSFD